MTDRPAAKGRMVMTKGGLVKDETASQGGW